MAEREEKSESLFTFDVLLNDAPLGVYWVDCEFRIRQLNSAALALFNGIPDIVGRDFDEISHAVWPNDFADEIMARFRHTLMTGEPFSSEKVEESRDPGTRKFFDEWQINRISLADGSRGVICYFRAIPRKVTDREALRESEERYRATFANAAVGIAHVAMDGRWLRFNDAVCVITGYPREELLDRTFADITHPEDIEADWALARRVLSGEIPTYSMEKRYIRKDGSIVWVNLTVSLQRDTHGTTQNFISIIEDITERKQAAQALRRERERLTVALNAGEMGVYDVNMMNNQVWWSPEMYTVYGVEMDFVPTGESFTSLVHPVDREAVWHRLQAAISQQQHAIAHEFRILPRDGTLRWISVRGQIEYDANGQAIRNFGVVQQITERKRAEEERARLLAREHAARTEAEAANRAKDQFLATVSHELRTPLNAILGWAQLLNMGKLSAKAAAQAIETIERNARAQADLIEDLLDTSRIISGKLHLSHEPVNIVQTIQTTLETIRPAAQAKSIELTANLDTPEGATVMGDATRLQQIIWNLLSNAVKFTPNGGHVGIQLTLTDAEALITVSDTGQGISPAFLPHVFERFQQSDSRDTRKHGGLGLGLAIVHHLTERHGGTVVADSRGPGQGATFTIKLPLNSRPMSPDKLGETPAARNQKSPDALPNLHGVHVLAVDDEASARDVITAILAQCGATVTATASAANALEILLRVRPDVLITDIGMPDQNGYDLLRSVRKLRPEEGADIPAIALTAYANAEDRTRALAAGFLRHISKPVQPVELADAIATVVEQAKGGARRATSLR